VNTSMVRRFLTVISIMAISAMTFVGTALAQSTPPDPADIIADNAGGVADSIIGMLVAYLPWVVGLALAFLAFRKLLSFAKGKVRI
jgi:hypothetical protein